MTAEQAERAVRAYNPWPGAFITLGATRLAIWSARVAAGPPAEPGTMAILERAPAVAFRGGWLILEEVQKPGGRRLDGRQFLNGERGTLPPGCGLRD
jgi:methionyl-tRNA formyltransferase